MYQEIVLLGIFLGVVLLTWRLTRRLRPWWGRILLRAFVVAFCFTPFLPHRSVEWVSPWPPASFWIWTGLMKGQVGGIVILELIWVTAVGVVVGLASMAIHLARKRKMNDTKTSAGPNGGPATEVEIR